MRWKTPHFNECNGDPGGACWTVLELAIKLEFGSVTLTRHLVFVAHRLEQMANFSVHRRLSAVANLPLRFARSISVWKSRRSGFRAHWWMLVFLLATTFWGSRSEATIVRYSTAYGNVDVRLYDSATPLSVANFLNYVNSGRFNESVIHRSIPGFIIQGGGFYYPTPTGQLASVPTDPPVLNEYGISNLRGTLAYAKVGPPTGQEPTPETINSATSGWFFNLDDNSSNLNNQNGGFTVFGRVVGNGMNVVDDIADLSIVNAGSPFDNLPIVDLAAVQARGSVIKSDLVFVHSITVLNLPAGDYDFNGTVNAADYNVWKSSFGSTTNAAADGNGDGVVNAADFTVWRDTFGQSSGAGAVGVDAVSVPEPGSAILASLIGTFWWCSRFLRRTR